MRGPVSCYTAMTQGAVTGARRLSAVGSMARGTGVMLLIIRRVNKALACGHRRRMTARTLAVQGYVTSCLMIDVMICPDTTGMTGRTDVRAAFMTCGRADQCVRRGIMTGRTAVMYLVVAAARKGRGRIRMTYRTACFDRYITRGYMIHTAVYGQILV